MAKSDLITHTPSYGFQFLELLWGSLRFITSLAIIGATLFLTLALFSYSPIDASLNTASTYNDVQNFAGETGAIISDILRQSFGLISFLIILYAFQLSVRFMTLTRPLLLWEETTRLSTFLLTCLFGSLLFAILGQNWDLTKTGGAIGLIVWALLFENIAPIFGKYAVPVSIFGAITLCILSSVFTFNIYLPRLFESISHGFYTIRKVFLMCIYMFLHSGMFIVKLGKFMVEMGQKSLRFFSSSHHFESDSFNETLSVKKPKKPKETSKKPLQEKKTYQKSLPLSKDGDYILPTVDLLKDPPTNAQDRPSDAVFQKNADLLHTVLGDYNVEGKISNVSPGPVVTLYELEPAPGVKSSRVIGLADDIARSMAAVSVRADVVPGRNAIGIEIPNKERQTVFFKDMLMSKAYDTTKAKLPLILGQNIAGEPIIADLAKMPHLLVAGTTGSGKSVGINTMILSLLFKLSPAKCRLIMVDPKMLELSVYDDIPHLLTPVVTDPARAVISLKWAVQEMEDRYRQMSKLGVRNIDGFNERMRKAIKNKETLTTRVQTGFDTETGKPIFEEQPFRMEELPYIVIVVDEFADLMLVAGKEVEQAIQRLAQMARAAGIHLIMATQRPSVDVITGIIKANFPTRISFQVTSKIDSRTILGTGGAEQLLGMGDMLYMPAGGRNVRVHGSFASDQDVEAVVDDLKMNNPPDYQEDIMQFTSNEANLDGDSSGNGGEAVDELYDEAVAIVAREKKASTSFIQRHLQIGYNRAARIIEEMEKQGVIGPANHVGKREILVSDHSNAA